jgi:hypothetical protein
MKTQYKLWQVILYLAVFLVVMGLVGREDMNAEKVLHDSGHYIYIAGGK